MTFSSVAESEMLRAWRIRLRTIWWWIRQRTLRWYQVETDLIDPAAIRFVAGVDVSFVKSSASDACAALVVVSYPALEVVYERCERVSLSAPYIPGFLAFRESPFLLRLLARLRTDRPELTPDVVMVDGNGVLHPSRFGLACHLGVLAGIPTVGVGKSLHCVDGLTREGARDLARRSCARAGDSATLVGASGAVWGAVLRAGQSGSSEFSPLYVSVGHGLSLKSAVELVRRCCRHRVPEPIRQADLRSREWLRLADARARDDAAAASGLAPQSALRCATRQ